MSFRQHIAFTGLYHEWQPGSAPKRYGEGFPETYDSAGNYLCEKIVDTPPFTDTHFVECPGIGLVQVIHEIGVLDVTYVDGITGAEQTLGERSALLPAPDYVQIAIGMESTYTRGGNTYCLPLEDPNNCPPTLDGAFRWVAEGDVGEFPFGVTETTVESGVQSYRDEIEYTTLGGASHPTFQGGLLRRAPDGLTYDGQPDNLGVDTLFPWADVAANPTIRVGLICDVSGEIALHEVGTIDTRVHVTPWYRLDQVVSANLMCVL